MYIKYQINMDPSVHIESKANKHILLNLNLKTITPLLTAIIEEKNSFVPLNSQKFCLLIQLVCHNKVISHLQFRWDFTLQSSKTIYASCSW